MPHLFSFGCIIWHFYTHLFSEPLRSHDTEISSMSPFAKILVCWGLGLTLGLLFYFISFLRPRDEKSETIYCTSHIIVAIILIIVIIPFYMRINVRCGMRQRSINKSIVLHFEKLKNQQRVPTMTITQQKSKLRNPYLSSGNCNPFKKYPLFSKTCSKMVYFSNRFFKISRLPEWRFQKL